MNRKFEWLPSYSAPGVAPVEIYEGGWWHGDESILKIKNWGVINPGWGKTSGTAVIGDREKPLPDSLTITWLSAAENVFYSLKTALPVQQMERLLNEGFLSIYSKQRVTYTELIAGLAPGGFVVLWLAGEKEQVELASFRAKPISIPVDKVEEGDLYMFAADYTQRMMSALNAGHQAELKTIDLKSNFWQQYHAKYRWMPGFALQPGVAIEEVVVSCINGEKEAHLDVELKGIQMAERARPQEIHLRWQEVNGDKFGAEITLDEDETAAAFTNLATTNADGLTMTVAINGVKILCTLRSKTHQFPLTKAVAGVYRISK